MEQVQINKWIRVALSLGIAVISWATAFDWNTITDPKTAGIMVGAIAFIKAVYATLAPSAGVDSKGEDGWIITQRAIKRAP